MLILLGNHKRGLHGGDPHIWVGLACGLYRLAHNGVFDDHHPGQHVQVVDHQVSAEAGVIHDGGDGRPGFIDDILTGCVPGGLFTQLIHEGPRG